jgi:glycine/D-amino acid oxidase-like deaminating enzyme/nitrite reductase/ring-hydroxylating ferredoxin subunit
MESNASLWSATATSPTFPALAVNAEVDVVVVGAGITGLTAAMLLAATGKRVSVVEARRIGCGVSHRSTTHLTEAIDTRYQEIESDFGRDGAKLVAQSSRAAIEKVGELVKAFSIPCDFTRRPGYLYTEKSEDLDVLRKELEAANRAGLPVELLAEAPLPFATKGALRFPDQAQMHMVRYLGSLATATQAKGAQIYEDSRVITVEDGEPCIVHLEHGPVIRAKHVFVATHTPLNHVFLQTKIAAYRSYVLAFPSVQIPDGLYWDTEDPYHYLSTFEVDDVPYLVLGGEDHKTGTTTNTEEHLDALLAWTKERIPVPAPSYRWSAQVEEPVDGLPFIGRSSLSEHVFVATGFSGNGTTFGTIAAMIVTDLVNDRASPWAELYSATRVKPVAAAGTYLEENIDFPMHLFSDRLQPPDAKTPGEIRPGEGKTIRLRGERLAVYRDPQGSLHAVSSVCTHLGCLVKFNNAEKTWDCPCHGSRFGVDGAVLDGPATRPLAKRALEARHASGTIEASHAPPASKRSRGRS